jgi:hypothetical protein
MLNLEAKVVAQRSVKDLEKKHSEKRMNLYLPAIIKDVCKKLDTLNLFEKEKNTVYEGGIKLSIADSDKLQSIVWNQIWEHHLVMDLLNDPYDYTQDRETIRLIKTPVRE